MNQAENGRVRTNAQREREHSHGGEAGVLQQLAEGEFEVVHVSLSVEVYPLAGKAEPFHAVVSNGFCSAFTQHSTGITLLFMKVLSYDALSRNFTEEWATIESAGEEVLVRRGRRPVASIVPEPPALTALEVFGDLHGLLGEAAGSALARKLAAIRKGRRKGTLHELRNPWAS